MLEMGYATRLWATLYSGLTYTQPRPVLSGALESNQVNGSPSRTNLLIPTVGVMLSHQPSQKSIRPSARLGIRVRSYKFDLAERWLPSTLNACSLPVRATGNTDQDQNEWLVQLGFRSPTRRAGLQDNRRASHRDAEGDGKNRVTVSVHLSAFHCGSV